MVLSNTEKSKEVNYKLPTPLHINENIFLNIFYFGIKIKLEKKKRILLNNFYFSFNKYVNKGGKLHVLYGGKKKSE